MAVGEAELGRGQPARSRRRSTTSARTRIVAPVAAVGARVHPDAAAGRAGDRAGELEPAEPGVARAVEADRVRRAAAGDEQRRPRRSTAASSPASRSDERVDAVVGGEQVRAEPDGRDREPALGAPTRSACSSSATVAGSANARAGPPVPIVVSRASGDALLDARSRRAASSDQRAPRVRRPRRRASARGRRAGPSRATSAAPVSSGGRPARAHARRGARRATSLPVTPSTGSSRAR